MKYCLIVAFIFLSLTGNAQEKEDKIDKELTACLEQKSSNSGMVACTVAATEKWDAKLNEVYKKLLAKLSPEAKQKLIDAQRSWLVFKVKEVELIKETYGNAKGTMWFPIRASVYMELTKGRALTLEALLNSSENF
jgi:uncharacterized protein YecT (DUF1311 family)